VFLKYENTSGAIVDQTVSLKYRPIADGGGEIESWSFNANSGDILAGNVTCLKGYVTVSTQQSNNDDCIETLVHVNAG
jgi:hypothetical protein